MEQFDIQLLHFNDVYHCQERQKEPKAGAARFATALRTLRSQYPDQTLVCCSGDCFSPSIESTISRGKHWLPIYAHFGIDVACYGNHEWDFGEEQLIKLASQCSFPFLISNVIDARSDEPVAQGKSFWIRQMANGFRVGFIGLMENEWLATLPDLPPTYQYKSFVDVGKELARFLRAEHKVDLVVALTHMRVPNDELLASSVPEIDLILGGHDHFYYTGSDESGRIRVVKSGSDFVELSQIFIKLRLKPDSGWEAGSSYVDHVHEILVKKHVLTSESFSPDIQVSELLLNLKEKLQQKLSKQLCYSLVPLDTRSAENRLHETNIGNLLADIMRVAYSSDVALLVGGSIRSDCLFEPGPITIGNILDIAPYEDPIIVLDVTGHILWEALENGLSMVPKTEGRFPQVSGCRLVYDSSKPPNSRLISVEILCPNSRHHRSYSRPPAEDGLFSRSHTDKSTASSTYSSIEDSEFVSLDKSARYKLAVRDYTAQGKDGYTMLVPTETNGIRVLVGEMEGCPVSYLLRRLFLGMRSLNLWMNGPKLKLLDSAPSSHHELHSSASQLLDHAGDSSSHRGREKQISSKKFEHIMSSALHRQLNKRKRAIAIQDEHLPRISPTVDGRIKDIKNC